MQDDSKTTAMAQAEVPPLSLAGSCARLLPSGRRGTRFPTKRPLERVPGSSGGADQSRRERLDPAQGWSLPQRRERPARPFPPPRPADAAAGRGGPAACSPIGWIWIRSVIGRSKRERATTNQKAGRGARGSYKRDRARCAVTRGSRQFERR